MLQELRDASNLLRSALGQYLNISLAIRSQFKAGRAFNIDVAAALDELEKLDSYESTVNQCKKALATLRNGCPAVVPVNNLPPELLSRIFFFTISRECFYLSRDNALLAHSSKSPGSFLHVCSYWRSVALGSHGLWAHIDLDPFTAFMKSHVKAGELLSARSGHSPLFVHVNLDGAARIEQLEGMLDLCTTVAQRAISLELEYVDSLEPAGIKILAKLLASCTPGHLTKLAIWSHTSSPQAFIMANDSELMRSDGHNFWPLDVSSHHLEGVLQNVSVLRLEEVYPWWGSQAYHGLVKLHLTDSSGRYLSLSQLANILNSSPQLRFLCIGTEIIEDTRPNPVRLDDLEVLQIEFGGSQLDSVLHLILPGSNPLRMSTALYGRGLSPDTLARGEHKKFFTRSTVVQLEAIWMSEDGNAYLDPRELPDLVPDLKVLRLRGVDLRLPPLDSTATARSPLGAQFTELRLSGSSIDPDVFQWVTNSYAALKVYIEERTCWISTEGRDLTDTEQWKEDWAEAYPMVQFVQEIGFAEESWD